MRSKSTSPHIGRGRYSHASNGHLKSPKSALLQSRLDQKKQTSNYQPGAYHPSVTVNNSDHISFKNFFLIAVVLSNIPASIAKEVSDANINNTNNSKAPKPSSIPDTQASIPFRNATTIPLQETGSLNLVVSYNETMVSLKHPMVITNTVIAPVKHPNVFAKKVVVPFKNPTGTYDIHLSEMDGVTTVEMRRVKLYETIDEVIEKKFVLGKGKEDSDVDKQKCNIAKKMLKKTLATQYKSQIEAVLRSEEFTSIVCTDLAWNLNNLRYLYAIFIPEINSIAVNINSDFEDMANSSLPYPYFESLVSAFIQEFTLARHFQLHSNSKCEMPLNKRSFPLYPWNEKSIQNISHQLKTGGERIDDFTEMYLKRLSGKTLNALENRVLDHFIALCEDFKSTIEVVSEITELDYQIMKSQPLQKGMLITPNALHLQFLNENVVMDADMIILRVIKRDNNFISFYTFKDPILAILLSFDFIRSDLKKQYPNQNSFEHIQMHYAAIHKSLPEKVIRHFYKEIYFLWEEENLRCENNKKEFDTNLRRVA